MPDYRLYILGQNGHIRQAHDLEAPDDEAARAAARALAEDRSAELWSRSRLVAQIDAERLKANI